MAVHEPDGATTHWLPLKTSRKCRAAAWASARQPLLKAGCPQQAYEPENSTWRPR